MTTPSTETSVSSPLAQNGRTLTKKGLASGNEVLAAAAEAFLIRGYAGTSIDDIADRLGCTKGRVYHYFRTKGEIFLGIHKLALETSHEAIGPLARADKPASERMHDMAKAHASLMMSDTGFMRLAGVNAEMHLASEGRTREAAVEEIFQLRHDYEKLFIGVIAEGVSSGEFVNQPTDLLAKAALGSLNWISVWYDPHKPKRSSRKQTDIAEAFADFVVKGLRPA